jgi:hypothetical protein
MHARFGLPSVSYLVGPTMVTGAGACASGSVACGASRAVSARRKLAEQASGRFRLRADGPRRRRGRNRAGALQGYTPAHQGVDNIGDVEDQHRHPGARAQRRRSEEHGDEQGDG